MPASVLWFRRDLRLGDNPALAAAAGEGAVLPLFVFDPVLWDAAGPTRRAYLVRSLRSLDGSLGGHLHIRLATTGRPVADVVADVAAEAAAGSVHVAADFGPYGSARDASVEVALAEAGRRLVRTGSSYAVAPGRVRKPDGSPYRVYSPFFRAWCAHGWRAPAEEVPATWVDAAGSQPLPVAPEPTGLVLPAVGEAAALERWDEFVNSGDLARYGTDRNRPDLRATSGLSAALRWGEIHPRTLLAELAELAEEGGRGGAEVFRKELAWREFYADVLHHSPLSAREPLRTDLGGMEHDQGPGADAKFAAWCEGRTGYPFVDAGMRQLLAEGWVHNRVRLVVASILVTDLHLDWTRGAGWFMHLLRDADLASNQHGWQWVAGTGTDAAPYYRVFNPVLQGLKFDPDGSYVRRYVAELAGVAGPAVHEPWTLAGGLPTGYPAPIVDHAEERGVALSRYAAAAGTPVRGEPET